ncbi:LOW QUALITY PROTEIN: protein-glutamine gamma-glutamyltransferase K [Cygnus atratus]|uniref:LOW QUALITY PROTEIN: protein-glutamine gamma-glutamyltransferase K n=1 Tax=Cygnus atratus TaxID=8868 RepID=UPI0021B7E82B|nr:LOW QUALITY PROTEIN: protein-glutamine gamma-glutamyltransferase K [Cygnus atratus]
MAHPIVPPLPNSEQEHTGLLAPRGLVVGSAANRVAHHTSEFACPHLVVRRGQPFDLRILLPRPFDPEDDSLCVELTLGPNPQVAKGTHVLIPLGETSATGWTAEEEELEEGAERPGGPALRLCVTSPPDAPIGRYRLSVKTRTGVGEYAAPFEDANDIILLFNPWCPDDNVYMEKTSDLNEYVLNETGRIFYGTEDQIAERSWNYGQFDAGVLEACLYILDRRGMPHSARGDPVMVSRVVSAMVNSLDDNGVLVGNWTGDYAQGTNPSAWAGSVDILRAYHRGGAPVRFGQCWVFAGVMTTVLRCLGLPTRTVTNYNSAHDTDVSLTTDIYFDENMRPMERLNTDSVWNFHVWNDCWMKRPDLPDGYDGWQVVDATPQETSSGLFCCGPCSVTAVKNGEVFLKYDTPFVFAEVNSDKVYWQRQPNGAFSVVHVEEGAIGRRISTLGAGSGARMDITHQYKHPEGSEEERRAVSTATSHGSRPRTRGTPSTGEVTVTVGAGPAVAGAELELRVVALNQGAEPRTLRLRLALAPVRYTGVAGAPFRQEQHRRAVPPGQEETVTMTVGYAEYGPHVGDQDALKLSVAGAVEETGQVVAKELRVRLQAPDLTLTLLAPAVVGQEVPVQVVFQNPLPRALTGAVLRMEGAGLSCPQAVTVGTVEAGQTLRLRQPVVPLRPGRRRLVAAMESAQLGPVHGTLQFDAAPDPTGSAGNAGSAAEPPPRTRRGRRRRARPAGSTGGPPLALRLALAGAWHVVRGRSLAQFPRVLRLLEAVVVRMLQEAQPDGKILDAIDSFFPEGDGAAMAEHSQATPRDLALVEEAQESFRELVLALLGDSRRRAAYLRGPAGREYGEPFLQALESLFYEFLQRLESALPPPDLTKLQEVVWSQLEPGPHPRELPILSRYLVDMGHAHREFIGDVISDSDSDGLPRRKLYNGTFRGRRATDYNSQQPPRAGGGRHFVRRRGRGAA